MSEGPRVVLVGMMGSGKSTIGRLIADATGWPAYDNDALLHEAAGLTAFEILERRGEAALRVAEGEALERGLAVPPPCIVDAAAGTIESPRIHGLLLDELVVWLRASPETLYLRSIGAAHRPWLDRGEDWFRSTACARDPLYESVADVVVDTDRQPPADAATQILERIRQMEPA